MRSSTLNSTVQYTKQYSTVQYTKQYSTEQYDKEIICHMKLERRQQGRQQRQLVTLPVKPVPLVSKMFIIYEVNFSE